MHRYAIALAALAVPLALRADDKGTSTELDGLKSTAPANWKSEKPMGMNRVYQFTIPKAEGEKYDSQLLIFQFPGGAGGVEANIARWKNMVKPAEGTKSEDAYKTSEFKVGDAKVTQFEAAGTYMFKARPMDADAEPRADHKFVGVIFEGPKGNTYFMRMVGPAKTMDANRKAFDEWLKNFK
jgi:hypothetical protein